MTPKRVAVGAVIVATHGALAWSLVGAPVHAALGAHLALGVGDWLVACAYGDPWFARARRAVIARGLGTVGAIVVVAGVLALARSSSSEAARRWGYPTLAIVLSVSAHAAATGDLPAGTRGRLAVGAMVVFADLAVLGGAVTLGASASGGDRARVAATAALAPWIVFRALAVRALSVAASAREGGSFPGAIHVAATFVAWVGAAAVTTTLAQHALAWSGLGAAIVLGCAAVLTEGRRRERRATVALTRATLGFIVASALSGVLVGVGREWGR